MRPTAPTSFREGLEHSLESDFIQCEHTWSRFSISTLANEADGISIVELVSVRMIEEYRHYVPDFRSGAPSDWQTP